MDRQKYAGQFPGEIEAKKLKTTMKMIEGKKREVVLVRKNPDGEWDLNLRTTTGVVQEERVDHGDEQIREGQMAAKYESSHKRLFSSLTVQPLWKLLRLRLPARQLNRRPWRKTSRMEKRSCLEAC